MARISTYIKDGGLTNKDLLIGSNYLSGEVGAEEYETANFTLGGIKNFIAGTGFVEEKVTLTPAQLLSLNGGGSVELIAAPGDGKVIVPVSVVLFLDYNTTAYNFSGVPSISGTGSISSTFLNSSSDKYWNLLLGGAYLEVNSALAISATSLSVTQGDSPLTLIITYKILDFS